MPHSTLLFLLLLLLHLHLHLPFLSSNMTSTIIPSFPSQTSLSPCHHLPLPPLLLSSIQSSCTSSSSKIHSLSRGRCCPTLAAWLYWSYSDTALRPTTTITNLHSEAAAMPMMPDDSETCVRAVEEGLSEKGVELGRVNESCGVVDCYCGIRLHGGPLSCSGVWRVVVGEGKGLRGMVRPAEDDERVRRLERDCEGRKGRRRGGCDSCLHSLYQIGKAKNGSTENIEDKRTSKMRSKECQLMGITWLLAKNRTAYMDTITSVLRAMMMSPDGSYPRSCGLNSNEFPIAVDSTEISSQSSASTLRRLIRLLWFSFCCLYLAF